MKRSIRFESELDDMVSRYVDPKKKERKNFSKTLHYMIKASKQFIEDTGYNFDELMRKGIKITIEREIIRQRLTYEPHRIEKETSQIPYSKEDRMDTQELFTQHN